MGARLFVVLPAMAVLGCPSPPPAHDRSAPATAEGAPEAAAPTPEAAVDARGEADAPLEGGPLEPADPMALHHVTTEELLELLPPARAPSLRWAFAYAPGRFNQGNKSLAHHAIGRRQCLDGLRGVTLQTDEQRARCRGFDNMVPIYRGDPATAKACIDIFEFPDRPCELPMVWGTPAQAEQVCVGLGKRLCADSEWNLACAADPAGGSDSTYAYGNDLDMTICNTDKPHPFGPDGQTWLCSARTAQGAWETCSTDTEPSGAFPKCRSRLGVYDQHGNVAEMMTRIGGGDAGLVTQLKGSAFFYVDVARKPTERQGPGRETYPDQCTFDPRWHVEPLSGAMHSNYHLGFRCCVSVR